MFVSMSRTIGNSISPSVSANIGTGPTLIIWCTAGVKGIAAPAIAAMRGLHTPDATTTISAVMSPRSVRTRLTRPFSTSMAVTSVIGASVSASIALARSRMIVPARNESTTPMPGVEKPPSTMSVLMYGTIALTCSGVTSSASIPHERDDAMRRLSSSIRSGVRATSMPPLWVKTPNSLYWLTLSTVSFVISSRVVGQEDEVRCMPGRAAWIRERTLLDQDDVAPPEPGEVVDEAVTDDAGADHHDARGTR